MPRIKRKFYFITYLIVSCLILDDNVIKYFIEPKQTEFC